MRATKQVALDMGCKYIYDEWGRVNLHADKLKIGDVPGAGDHQVA